MTPYIVAGAFVLGAFWRRYYGYWTHGIAIPRVGGKYGAIATLAAVLAPVLWYLTGDPWVALAAVPAALMWAPGFGDWAHWSGMAHRYTAWTCTIALGLVVYTGSDQWLPFAAVGLVGLCYPALNRVQKYVPIIGYTEWCEFITGGAVIGTLALCASL